VAIREDLRMNKLIRKTVFATFVLLSVGAVCWAWIPGRMTGGGSFFQVEQGVPTRITHGFELYCQLGPDITEGPNNLEVNWNGNRFHLEQLTSGICTDEHGNPAPPAAPFTDYYGMGTGRYNGVEGATAIWHFTDQGEPGVNDQVIYLIVFDANGTAVLSTSGPATLTFGNHQAHAN
jgi:hypothetical protein